jgi:hypothetical protein
MRVNDVQLPPLEISIQGPETADMVWNHFGARPDLVLTVMWADKEYPFVVEQKTSSTPRTLETAIRQVKHYADLSQNRYRPMVLVPYLNPRSLDKLVATGVSGIDFSGNGLVNVPGELFVYRTGEKNRFPTSTPIRNVYRGSASLVSRMLLSHGHFSSVTDLSKEIRIRGGSIALSTTSKALRTLQEEMLVGRRGGIRLLQPARLLDLLVENYRGPDIERRILGRVDDVASAVRKLSSNAQVLGMPVACNRPSLYSVLPDSNEIVEVYTPSSDRILHDIGFQETDRFPNMALIDSQDRTLYFDRREMDGAYWVSPLEAYLMLTKGGKREKEAAEQIRPDLLDSPSSPDR